MPIRTHLLELAHIGGDLERSVTKTPPERLTLRQLDYLSSVEASRGTGGGGGGAAIQALQLHGKSSPHSTCTYKIRLRLRPCYMIIFTQAFLLLVSHDEPRLHLHAAEIQHARRQVIDAVALQAHTCNSQTCCKAALLLVCSPIRSLSTGWQELDLAPI